LAIESYGTSSNATSNFTINSKSDVTISAKPSLAADASPPTNSTASTKPEFITDIISYHSTSNAKYNLALLAAVNISTDPNIYCCCGWLDEMMVAE